MLPTLTLLDILKYIQQNVSNMQNVNIVIVYLCLIIFPGTVKVHQMKILLNHKD